MIDTKIDISESGELQEIVEVQMNDLDELDLRWRMPSGISDRVANNEIESQDIRWFDDVVETATGLDASKLGNKKTLYIVDCVARLIDDEELKTYNEFTSPGEKGKDNFLSEGTLGVKND